MTNFLRPGAGLVAGTLAAGASAALIEAAAHAATSGPGLFWAAAFGVGVAALIGGLVAVAIGRRAWLSWVVATVLALLTLVNVISFAHPAWFVPVAGIALAAGAWIAIQIADRSEKPA